MFIAKYFIINSLNWLLNGAGILSGGKGHLAQEDTSKQGSRLVGGWMGGWVSLLFQVNAEEFTSSVKSTFEHIWETDSQLNRLMERSGGG